MDKIFKSKQITNGVAELALENIISTPSFVMNGVGSHPTVYNGDIPANSHDGVSGAEELILGTSCKSIGDSAFAYCTSLTGNLVIPDSVTSIGEEVFRNCTGLTGTLTIGSGVTTIEDGAFANCSTLTGSLVIPDSVTSIENYTFGSCSGFTGDLVIPDNVTIIKQGAFSNCSGLTGDLVIPDSVTSIETFAFDNCSGFDGTLTIGNSVESIETYAFKSCTNITRVDCYVEKSILDQPAILVNSGVLQIHVRSTDTTWLSSGAPDNEGLQTIGSLSGIEVFKDL